MRSRWSSVSRTVWALLAVSLAIALVAAPATAAPGDKGGGGKKGDYTLTINPVETQVGARTQFAVTVTNSASSSNDIGSVQVLVPAAFADVVPGTDTVPTGFVYNLPTCSPDSPAGCASAVLAGATLVEVATPSNGGASKVGPGGSLTFFVTATAVSKGQHTWSTDVKNSAAWSSGQILTQQGLDPVVTVTGAPAMLVFTQAPPSQLVAGTSFDARVQVQDADGDPTPSDASVTLSGTDIGGTTTTEAVGGTATFTGLALTTAGSITVTASSESLTSATTVVEVKPGPPADLVVTPPSAAVTAGGTLTVDVDVEDLYGNLVDPQVAVSLSVEGVVAASQTTVAGSTTFNVAAPTAAGPYSLTVSSGTLTETYLFTVVAAEATQLTIDSVTAQGGAGGFEKDAPFDVAVTARDAYGNPSSYSGTVSLGSTGGTGVLGGDLVKSIDASSSVTFTGVTYSGYGNAITLTASSGTLTPGTANLNVNLYFDSKQAAPKQAVSLENGGCGDATPEVPVCSTLVLPNGARGTISLSLGECTVDCLVSGSTEALEAEALADLSGLYDRRNPATIILRCDKTLCGGAGVNNFPILFQATGQPNFAEAPACPRKGQVGPEGFCQDFRQNSRDNAGDLVAYLLFIEDAKATFR